MLNEYESIFGQIMSEEKFAKFQQSNPWFTIAFGQDLRAAQGNTSVRGDDIGIQKNIRTDLRVFRL